MSNADIISMYSSSQQGGELPYFVGNQHGSGWFRALGRFALPILKKLGLSAAKAATGALAATATDVLSRKMDILPALKENIKTTISENLPAMKSQAMDTIDSLGRGVKRQGRNEHKSINKRRRMYGTIFQK